MILLFALTWIRLFSCSLSPSIMRNISVCDGLVHSVSIAKATTISTLCCIIWGRLLRFSFISIMIIKITVDSSFPIVVVAVAQSMLVWWDHHLVVLWFQFLLLLERWFCEGLLRGIEGRSTDLLLSLYWLGLLQHAGCVLAFVIVSFFTIDFFRWWLCLCCLQLVLRHLLLYLVWNANFFSGCGLQSQRWGSDTIVTRLVGQFKKVAWTFSVKGWVLVIWLQGIVLLFVQSYVLYFRLLLVAWVRVVFLIAYLVILFWVSEILWVVLVPLLLFPVVVLRVWYLRVKWGLTVDSSMNDVFIVILSAPSLCLLLLLLLTLLFLVFQLLNILCSVSCCCYYCIFITLVILTAWCKVFREEWRRGAFVCGDSGEIIGGWNRGGLVSIVGVEVASLLFLLKRLWSLCRLVLFLQQVLHEIVLELFLYQVQELSVQVHLSLRGAVESCIHQRH